MEDLNIITHAQTNLRQLSALTSIPLSFLKKQSGVEDAEKLFTFDEVKDFMKLPDDKKVITIASDKGGMGKTKLSYMLTSILQLTGKRVLAIDFDGQANFTTNFTERSEDQTLYNYFEEKYEGRLSDLIYKVDENLSLIRSGENMKNLDLWLNAKFHFDKEKGEFSHDANSEKLFIFIEEFVEAIKSFDVVIIDTPPNFGLLQFLTFIVSNNIIVPINSTSAALEGVDSCREYFLKAREYNENLKMDFLINHSLKVRSMLALKKDTEELKERIRDAGFKFYSNEIPYTDLFYYAMNDGVPFWLVDLSIYEEEGKEIVEAVKAEIESIIEAYSEIVDSIFGFSKLGRTKEIERSFRGNF